MIDSFVKYLRTLKRNLWYHNVENPVDGGAISYRTNPILLYHLLLSICNDKSV